MVMANTAETNPDGGGNYVDAACKCHVMVKTAVHNPGEDGGFVNVESEILASNDPAQVGKTYDERFYLKPNQIGRFIQLGCATGLCTKDQWKSAQASGQNMDIDETVMPGRQYKIDIHMDLEFACTNKPDGTNKCGHSYGKGSELIACPQCGANRRRWPQTGFRLYPMDEQPDTPVNTNFGGGSPSPATQQAQQPAQQAQQPAQNQQPAQQQAQQQPAQTEGQPPAAGWGGF